jgi:putative DNA primase/helicase
MVGKEPQNIGISEYENNFPSSRVLEKQFFHFPNNDFGNSQRLIEQHGDDMMFVQGMGWLVWDGCRWARDLGSLLSIKKAHDIAGLIRQEANAIDVGRLAGQFFLEEGLAQAKAQEKAVKFKSTLKNWGTVSGNQSKVNAMLSASEPYLTISVPDMDNDDYLICLVNGTLDLRAVGMEDKGRIRFRPHAREDRITLRANVEYDPNAVCPGWTKFLAQVVPDVEVRIFLQRFFGSMLSGDTSEQCLALFYGDGANGKSTCMEVIADILGDYAKGIPISSLLKNERKSGSESSPDLARLRGTRYLRTSEPEAGSRLSTSLIKQLTGGEPITVRELYHDFFELNPKFKIVVAFNNQPTIRGGDHGIWRRLKMIPFNTHIPENERDPHLSKKLRKERPGILNWMLDGYRNWQDLGGLNPPSVIDQATEEYRDEQDHISVFFRECILPCEGQNIQAKELYGAYCVWCESSSKNAYSATMFGKLAVERGFKKEKFGVTYYKDIKFSELIPPPDD